MKIDFKRLDDLNARMTLVIEYADYGPKLDENIKKYSKKVAIKGFRSGKTPKSVLTKMYGKGMLEETVNGLLNEKLFGYLDDETSSVHRLVKEWKIALPLHAEAGTGPNVFYVPPLAPYAFNEAGEFDETRSRIPEGYLEQMFGPGVEQALATIQAEREKSARGEPSELMDILIARDWNDLLGPFTENPADLDRQPRKG